MTDAPTLGTYAGLNCHHWNEELPLIADVLSSVRPRLVVELGTMYGGFAAFLADVVKPWSGEVVTFDRTIYPGLEDALSGRENLYFVRADVNSSFGDALIRDFLYKYNSYGHRTCLYADAQPGRAEFFSFGDLADLSGIHDYGTEVSAERLRAWETENWRVPYRHDVFGALQDSKGGYFVSRFWVIQGLREDRG